MPSLSELSYLNLINWFLAVLKWHVRSWELTAWMNYIQFVLFTPFHAETGRTDVVNTINDFVFTPAIKTAFENFTIVDDDVLEFDELFIAEFNFDSEISNNWNARKGVPSIAFILITDDDCELCSENIKPKQLFCTIF